MIRLSIYCTVVPIERHQLVEVGRLVGIGEGEDALALPIPVEKRSEDAADDLDNADHHIQDNLCLRASLLILFDQIK